MGNEDLIISLLRGINDNIGNVSSGGSTINPDELIPLEPLPTPPEDTLYYRTYVDDVVYIGSRGGYSGYAGVDSLGNIYFNHRGVFTVENLKESLESPSAQVGVLNEFITEISVPDNVNILGRTPSQNLKTIIANNVWEMSQDFKSTLWYTQKEQGPVKLGSLLFGYKGTVPAETTLEVTQDVKNINSSAFIGTEVESVILHDSIEKVGTRAFYETPFIKAFEDGPIYFGKTLYDIIGTYKVDTFAIPEGIKYINILGSNVINTSGSSGTPSGDSGVGDVEQRDFFNVSINRINIPSTAILTENPFGGVKDLTYLGFPQILPTMSEYWLGSGGSGSSGISGSTGGISQAYYDGTIQLFKDLLQITGTDWIDNSSIIVVYCTDGELWLEDVKVAAYTTYDGSTIPGSLGYGKFIIGDDFHLSNNLYKFDVSQLESIVFDECTILGRPYYDNSVFDWSNIKYIDLSKVYLDNGYSLESSSIPTVKECSLLETYLSPYEIGPNYYNTGDTLGYGGGAGYDYNYVCVSSGTFNNCTRLHTIILPRNLSVIHTNAFYNCTSLNNIILPNTVKYIESSAFLYCHALDNLTYEGTMEEWQNVFIGYEAFNYSSLEVVHCSDGDVRIATIIKGTAMDESYNPLSYKYYYYNNGQLIVNFDYNLYPNYIPENAFNGMYNLTSVEIPNYIESIGSLAFNDCTCLTEIISLNPVPPTIQSNTFTSVDKSIPLYVPDVEAYLNAEYWSEFTNILSLNSDYELVVNSSDESMGTVQIDVHSILQSSVTATPNEGYRFVSWTNNGEVVSTELTYKFVALEDLTLVANFEAIPQYTVAVSYDDTMGTVSGQGTYHEGSVIELTATPNEGYRFTGWSDGSTESVRQLTITSNIELTALFEIKMCTVNVAATEGGAVTGTDSGVYPYGSEITIEAIPEEGYEFYRWSNGNTSSSVTINVLDNLNIAALFNDASGKIIYYTTTNEDILTLTDVADFGSNLIDNLYN